MNFSTSDASLLQMENDGNDSNDLSDSSNTSIRPIVSTNPALLPRRFQRLILRTLIADPSVEYNDPIFNTVTSSGNQTLNSKSNNKISAIISNNNINCSKYYKIHQELEKKKAAGLQKKRERVKEQVQVLEQEYEDLVPVEKVVRKRGRPRKVDVEARAKKAKLEEYWQEQEQEQDNEDVDDEEDEDNSPSNSFTSLPFLKPSDFSKPIQLTKDQIKLMQDQQQERSGSLFQVPQMNYEWSNTPVKKSKDSPKKSTPVNDNSKNFPNHSKKINFDKHHINSTNKVAIQANKAYAANAAKYIASNNNDRILKLYGQIDASGNGWVDIHNNKIKLEKILLDKFSKSEIEKISCETEDNACQVCHQKLHNYWEYVQHIDLHNRAIPDYHFKHVHFCPVDICPMTMIGFSKKRDLRHHIHNYHFYRSNIVEKYKPWETVMRELSYNCIWTGCASSFCRKDVLTRHIKLNHEKAADVKPGECYNCHTLKTSLWYKDPEGETICNACYQFQRKYLKPRPGVDRRLNATEGKKLVNIGPKDFKRVFGVEPN